MVAMIPTIAVPPFEGKEESFLGYAMEVDLRSKVARLEEGKRASALVFQMEPIARDACMALGSGQPMGGPGAPGSA